MAPEILVGDAVRGGKERRITDRRARAERIEPGREVPVAPNRLGEVDRADNFLERDGAGRASRRLLERRRRPALEQRARLVVYRRWILAVFLVELENIAAIEPSELLPARHDLIDFNRYSFKLGFRVSRGSEVGFGFGSAGVHRDHAIDSLRQMT